jgi:hypothetical protein
MKESFKTQQADNTVDTPLQELETHILELEDKNIQDLETLLSNNASEKKIQKYLETNKALLAVLLSLHHTGHNGTWVVSRQAIRNKIKGQNIRGLIPDFIICGRNSDGFSYWVVEIKSPKESIFTANSSNEIYFSSEVNKGICQLIEYVDFCDEQQSFLRDQYKFQELRSPNGMLIVGRESELDQDPRKQKMKSAWNRIVGSRLEIRSYDWLLHTSKSIRDSNLKCGLE